MWKLSLCLLVSVLTTAASGVSAQSRLPPCPGSFNAATWTNCLGTFTWRDGQKYVGEWKDGQSNGQGTTTFRDGGKYVGEFSDGKFHGQGTFAYPNGNQYVGEWRNGSPNGKGTATYRNGEKHAGEWKDGKLYAGEYKDGKPNGRGTMRLTDGRKYVGEFRDGKYHGKGTYTWPSGDKYVGEYRDDKRNGQGTYTYADGTKDVGEWKDDKSKKSVRSREAEHQVIATAVGLRPIGELPFPAGDELRLWVFTHRVTQPMYLLRESPAGVSGEFVIWWGQVYGRWADDPTGQAYDMSAIIRKENEQRRKWVKTRWNCAKLAAAALFDACRTSFERQPDWSRLLRALEREGAWDLPDSSTLPRDVAANRIADGVVLLVEVRRGGKTRRYSYANPSYIPGPEGRSAKRILTVLGEFETLLESWR